jgi:hypothetical protein
MCPMVPAARPLAARSFTQVCMAWAETAPILASPQRGRTCLSSIDSWPALVFGSSSSQVSRQAWATSEKRRSESAGFDVGPALDREALLVHPTFSFAPRAEHALDLRRTASGRIWVAGSPAGLLAALALRVTGSWRASRVLMSERTRSKCDRSSKSSLSV